MIIKIISQIFFVISLFIIQVGFISGLPSIWNQINLIIIILIFILGLSGLKTALPWACGIGIMLDFYMFLPFGTYFVSLVITILFSHFLITNFFTNRSLYSFSVAITMACITFNVLLYAGSFMYSMIEPDIRFFTINFVFFTEKIYGLLANLVLVIFIFYFIIMVSNKFKPVFLIKRK